MTQTNKVVIVGQLAVDPKQRAALNGKAVAIFTASVRRNCKNKNGEYVSVLSAVISEERPLRQLQKHPYQTINFHIAAMFTETFLPAGTTHCVCIEKDF